MSDSTQQHCERLAARLLARYGYVPRWLLSLVEVRYFGASAEWCLVREHTKGACYVRLTEGR